MNCEATKENMSESRHKVMIWTDNPGAWSYEFTALKPVCAQHCFLGPPLFFFFPGEQITEHVRRLK